MTRKARRPMFIRSGVRMILTGLATESKSKTISLMAKSSRSCNKGKSSRKCTRGFFATCCVLSALRLIDEAKRLTYLGDELDDFDENIERSVTRDN